MVCLVTLPAPAAESEKQTIKVPPEIEKAMQMPTGKGREKVLNPAIVEWAKQDPTAALAWALELPASLNAVHLFTLARCGEAHGKVSADWLLQRKAYSKLHFVLCWWSQLDPSPALEWCMQAPDEARHLSFASLANGWTYKDPKEATAGFMKLKSMDDQCSMAYGICKAWIWSTRGHPELTSAATTWALALEPKEVRLAGLYGIGSGWGRCYLPSTTTWIKTLKNKDEMRAAAYGVVKCIQMGLTEKQQGTERARDVELYKPAYAKEWLDQLPLSDTEKTYILNAPNITQKDTGKVTWPK